MPGGTGINFLLQSTDQTLLRMSDVPRCIAITYSWQEEKIFFHCMRKYDPKSKQVANNGSTHLILL